MTKPTAVGCFVYAGGFTEGMKSEFDVLRHYENTVPYGRAVSERNHPRARVVPGPWAVAPVDADVTFANPPCAPFSSTGYTAGKSGDKWVNDPRLKDHLDSLHAGRLAGSDLVVLESVQAAAVRGREFYRKQLQSFGKGWALTFLNHEACRLGVPQRRKRVFIVYHRVKLDAFERDQEETVLEDAVWKNVETHGVMGMPAGGRASLLQHIPFTEPGEKLKKGMERNLQMYRSRTGCTPSLMSARLKWGVPTPTMSGTYGYAHPDYDRFITVGEYQRLCGFRDDYDFGNAPSLERVLLMTRGVMPPVAERLAQCLKGSLQNRPVTKTEVVAC